MSDYTERVAAGTSGLEFVSVGYADGCRDCKYHGYTEELAEPYFSFRECDFCGSRLGGDRHPAHGITTEKADDGSGRLCHCAVCTDCLFYIANGEEPEEDNV